MSHWVSRGWNLRLPTAVDELSLRCRSLEANKAAYTAEARTAHQVTSFSTESAFNLRLALARLEDTILAAVIDGTTEYDIRDQLLEVVPSLRAFAYSLTSNWDNADDLVQDTLVRAWSKLHQFERGTNLHAWLFTILRNFHFSKHRKHRREVEDPEGAYANRLRTHAEQPSHLDFEDFQRALATLNVNQREALLLVGAEGLSYEEAAAVCGVPVGTLKSRVNRARAKLSQILDVGVIEDIGPDQISRAALQR